MIVICTLMQPPEIGGPDHGGADRRRGAQVRPVPEYFKIPVSYPCTKFSVFGGLAAVPQRLQTKKGSRVVSTIESWEPISIISATSRYCRTKFGTDSCALPLLGLGFRVFCPLIPAPYRATNARSHSQITLALEAAYSVIGRHPRPRELEEVKGLDAPGPIALESRQTNLAPLVGRAD
jgi:hypothetical protein